MIEGNKFTPSISLQKTRICGEDTVQIFQIESTQILLKCLKCMLRLKIENICEYLIGGFLTI